MTRRFRLAPMDPLILGLTAFMLVLPVVMLAVGTRVGAIRPAVLMMGVIYAAVWLWFRPTRFELSPEGLAVIWPIRRTQLARPDIEGVELIDKSELKARYGKAMRVGAGGLWGGFGLLLTTKGGRLRFYISRVDRYVLVRMKHGHSWLITPERPEAFVCELEALVAR